MQTFIVRIWAPMPDLAAGVCSEELRGNVELIPSRQRLAFGSTERLIEILRRPAAEGPSTASVGNRPSIDREETCDP